ncbi:MAG: hypothetical protein H7124_04665 [Phycisphaerales bacterium]|nr:hypothetical protein [Hyphomonadaceae bacterium]
MRGTILGIHDGRGVLIAADQRRLDFSLSEWRSPGSPAAGQIVDFMEEGGQARGVFAVPGASGDGAHSSSFVLGAVALGCLALGFIVPLIPTIAAFVLGVIGAGQAQAQRDETALTMARVAWIGALVMLVIGVLAIMAVIAFVGTLGFASLFQLGPGDF